jgi:hypothetical protein
LIDHPCGHPALFALNAAKDQRTVGAPKAKIVLDRNINLYVPRGIGTIIQVALGILIENVDPSRNAQMNKVPFL